MKRVAKPVFFIVAAVIALLAVLSIFGISTQYADKSTVYIKGVKDIRIGIDMRGGVDVTFTPPEDIDATKAEMSAAEEVIKNRLVTQNITDAEVYTDYDKQRIIVMFPWSEEEENYDPEAAIKELGETAELTFREGIEVDTAGLPTGTTLENVILTGKDIKEAFPSYDEEQGEFVVVLNLNDSGVESFSEATTRLAGTGEVISIWMDDAVISYPTVNTPITGGSATISGSFDADSCTALANKINAGALPFSLVTENFSTISPTLGEEATSAMLIAAVIAILLICVFLIGYYRLPGTVASIAIIGQAAGLIAGISGFFPFIDSFTLTLPGIAGIILSIGMGVDANIIAAERIKDELRLGKTINTSVYSGFKKAFTAVLDGNITVIIIAVILMGAFGPANTFLSDVLSPIFFMFGPNTAGAIYSFGYTLIVGVVLNFVFGIGASQLMLKSLVRFESLQRPWMYGGKGTLNNENF